MLCKYCNQPTPDGSAFCQMCGKSLIDGADVPAPGEPIPSVRPEGQTVTLPAAEDTASSDADASRLESVLSPGRKPVAAGQKQKKSGNAASAAIR